jgi:acetyltransferase
MAIVAEIQGDKRQIIGVARVISEPGRNCGEFAVVVGDPWQGLGLGSKLIDYIIEIGKEMDLKEVYGFVSSGNVKMIHLCTKRGFRIEPIDSETFKAVMELP